MDLIKIARKVAKKIKPYGYFEYDDIFQEAYIYGMDISNRYPDIDESILEKQIRHRLLGHSRNMKYKI